MNVSFDILNWFNFYIHGRNGSRYLSHTTKICRNICFYKVTFEKNGKGGKGKTKLVAVGG